MDSESPKVVWHEHQVTRDERQRSLGQRGCVVWFTGLSGCGKSTVANLVDRELQSRGAHCYLLDGDNVRHGLNATPDMLSAEYGPEFAQRFGLGFAATDRSENIRRVAAVAQLFCAAGLVTLTAFVSPYRRDRLAARQQVTRFGSPNDFIEIFVDAPLEVCEQRDPKGLYRLARAGKIRHFTGIDDPYEAPESPELVLKSADAPPDQLAAQVVDFLINARKILQP
ncbi:MAG: adenylyl-sulfate kinase [Pirellulales bacterium]